MQQHPTPQQTAVGLMVGVVVLAFLGILALALVSQSHNLDLTIDNDNRVVACGTWPDPAHGYTLPVVRGQLGCYRNSNAQDRAKDALRLSLGQGCEALAAVKLGDAYDLNGVGQYTLATDDVKRAYALAREVKKAGIACSPVPRDPDDHSVAVVVTVCGVVLILSLISLAFALRTLYRRRMASTNLTV